VIPESNGTVEAADAQPLKRVIYFDRVTELLATGMDKPAAFEQVAGEMGTTASNISGGYYVERRHRTLSVTEGVDPQAAIMEALSAIEEAVATAKVVIASATMQYERLREDAGKYAELRKQFR